MRTEATVESSEASLREAFQQLQGGSNATAYAKPSWPRNSYRSNKTYQNRSSCPWRGTKS